MGDGITLTRVNGYSNRAGGVDVLVGGHFIMQGGSITNNMAFDGGVVSVHGSSFTMQGGSISNNSCASAYGGGVFISNGSTFNMFGGEISNNNAVGNDSPGTIRIYGFGG